jgi:uroporphyrinogen-III synthase
MRVLSTKKLLQNQRELLLNAGLSFLEYDALDITFLPFALPTKSTHYIITSQNGARVFLAQQQQLSDATFFCVGEKTASLLSENNQNVVKIAKNGADLARFIIKHYKNEAFTYFCGSQRRDELPALLKEATICCNEITVYETHVHIQAFDQTFDGVLFYSPLGVSAFAKANPLNIAFCIGETTAEEAKKHTNSVVISNATTIESTIAKAVNYLKT